MRQVSSADGTTIAYELLGEGRPVIVVGGATCDRARMRGVSSALAEHFAVVNYDRRGRGDSGDTQPFAPEREVEDLAALIEAAGGRASLYGHSSGSAVVLRAVVAGLPVERFVMHEPPYGPEPDDEARDYHRELHRLLAEDRRGDAIALFFSGTGMPDEMLDEMRASPMWASLEALAPTLAYDSAAMADDEGGGVPHELLAAAPAVPGLVLIGGDSPDWFLDAGRAIAAGLPDGTFRELPGEDHVVEPERLAPVLREFLAAG